MSKAEQLAEVGRLVDSNQADDRKIIRLVKERKLLYARNNMPIASYCTQAKRLWEDVAREMGWSVGEVRRKWSHIRNSYSRHLRNELQGARTGRGRAVSRWYLADELHFLREHMATDTRASPYSPYAPTFLEMDIGESSNAEQVDVKPFIANPWFSLNPQSGARVAEAAGEPALLADRPDPLCCRDFASDENSSYFQFFRGIYTDYQELSAKKRRFFKRQCLNFLHDLLDEEEEPRAPACCQRDAVNLSNSAQASDDEKETTPNEGYCILPSD